jgi:hypothetical protein
MDTRPYEMRFEVRAIPEDIEDAVAEAFDCLISSHSGVTSVTLSAQGDTCLAAALSVIETLRDLGAAPTRLIDDLVGRREIARRAGVTPQAVGLWIRGERHTSSHFPPPFIDVGGGLWLWGEVVPALAERGLRVDVDVQFPTRLDSQRIGGILAAMQIESEVGGSSTDPTHRPVELVP